MIFWSINSIKEGRNIGRYSIIGVPIYLDFGHCAFEMENCYYIGNQIFISFPEVYYNSCLKGTAHNHIVFVVCLFLFDPIHSFLSWSKTCQSTWGFEYMNLSMIGFHLIHQISMYQKCLEKRLLLSYNCIMQNNKKC